MIIIQFFLFTVGAVDGQAVIGEALGAVGAKEGSNVSNDLHLKNTLVSTYNVSAKVMLKSF